MTENDIIRERFTMQGYKKVSVLIKTVKSQLTAQTWCRMLRGNAKIDLRTLLIMSSELNMPSAQLKGVLAMRGEIIIAELLPTDNISRAEWRLLEKVRELKGDPGKMQFLMDVIDHMEKPVERRSKERQ